MAELAGLSTHHCVLLAAQYATESNINALRTLTALRRDDLEFGLILRLLLTFLPEILEPSKYIQYLDELASDSRASEQSTALNVSSVRQLSDSQARKKARRLHVSLQSLAHPLYESETELDHFTHFLIHRSHRIDAETGLLEFVPQLVSPFLSHSDYLRTWFVSTVLPLLRLGYEYYPSVKAPSLETFATWKGKPAIECLLSNLRRRHDTVPGPDMREPARDLRGIVGPWLCGEGQREHRRLDAGEHRASIDPSLLEESDDWECLFEWLVHTAKDDFALTWSALSGWDGPTDMDFGGYDEGQVYFDEDQQGRLEHRYAQAAIASIYLVQDSSMETIRTAHALLARLGSLLGFELSPDLTWHVDAMPRYSTSSPISQDSTTSVLQDEQLLRAENPITQPDRKAVGLLELFVFSAFLLSGLEYSTSVRDVARMYLRNDQAEQLALLHKVLHTYESTHTTAEQWGNIRSILLWLWEWGGTIPDGDRYGHGIFGKIENKTIETEILKAFLESCQFALAIQVYLQPSSGQPILSPADVETVVLGTAMHHFDNASNGNRTRGGVKRASDIIAAFKAHFPSSSRFQRTQALLDATHAMSFYSLTLQHGVPFQPVNIRVSSDPLSLLQKLLSQNPTSYTHLDDLISIGQNLVVSMPASIMDVNPEGDNLDPGTFEKRKAAAEKRVIGMAIEAALENDDFETAYSYVVNRLASPATSPVVSPALQTAAKGFYFGAFETDNEEDQFDDVSWRAALKAGRHPLSPLSSSVPWLGSSTRPDLRGLEQRMELLSKALILAPPSHLEEVLDVWLQCEKDMNSFLAEEAEVEERFNDNADRRLPGAFANETVAVQPRREVGRGAVEESPLGLFDVARGAAAAFTKTAFPLRAGVSHPERRDTAASQDRVSMDLSSDSGSIGGEERVRRRDMLSSAVTGGLASGIGWVLGANPAPADRERY